MNQKDNLINVWTPSKLAKKNGQKNYNNDKKWYRCFYPHRLRDSVSPACGIFGTSNAPERFELKDKLELKFVEDPMIGSRLTAM